MPADVRVEKERALAGYRADFEKAKASVGPRKRNDIVSRYHMVRFFGMLPPQPTMPGVTSGNRAAKGHTDTEETSD